MSLGVRPARSHGECRRRNCCRMRVQYTAVPARQARSAEWPAVAAAAAAAVRGRNLGRGVGARAADGDGRDPSWRAAQELGVRLAAKEATTAPSSRCPSMQWEPDAQSREHQNCQVSQYPTRRRRMDSGWATPCAPGPGDPAGHPGAGQKKKKRQKKKQQADRSGGRSPIEAVCRGVAAGQAQGVSNRCCSAGSKSDHSNAPTAAATITGTDA
jgi:hypothetical protein